jgi:hypothetical protein
MNKKRVLSIVLVGIFVLITLLNFFLIYTTMYSDFWTGMASGGENKGGVGLTILSSLNFSIVDPVGGQSYNFNLSDRVNLDGIPEFLVDLNVAPNRPVPEWHYTLVSDNLEYGEYYTYDVFVPNSTIPCRVGWNNLTVFAEDALGTEVNHSVRFYINVSSSAPIIEMNDSQNIYGCEDSIFEYPFNITDYDDEPSLISVDIDPRDPFYAIFLGVGGGNISVGQINSHNVILREGNIGNYSELLTVNDGIYLDSVNIFINILETNGLPNPQEDMGAKMIWNKGSNNTLYEEWSVLDSEDGASLSGEMSFTLNYTNGSSFEMFNISEYGIMNFSAGEDTPLGIYELTACVIDNSINNSHQNLTQYCSQDGSNNTVCDNFTLNVVNINRPPIIVGFDPNGTITVNGNEEVVFSVLVLEPDLDPFDIDWYIDGVYLEHHEVRPNGTGGVYIETGSDDHIRYGVDLNKFYDTLSYSFPCGSSGVHTIYVEASDGLLFDNETLTVNLNEVECAQEDSGGGGGGGGGGMNSIWCFEEWECGYWEECVSVEESFNLGLFNLDSYYNYIDRCNQITYDGSKCGFQTRTCVDLNSCNNTEFRIPRGEQQQLCHFVSDPGCSDSVKNCHSGGCELLVDCGGPCSACPTCSDGIQNQNEGGIDCGGPCPYSCNIEEPIDKIDGVVVMLVFLIIVAVLAMIGLFFKLLVVIFGRNRDTEKKEKSSVFRGKFRKDKIKNLIKKVEKGDS